MRCRISLFVNAILLSLSTVCLCDDKQDILTLIEKARSISDIRATDCGPFRLEANFTLYEGNERRTGTYKEYKGSAKQHRSETASGDFIHIEVTDRGRRWRFDTFEPQPPGTLNPESKLSLNVLSPQFWIGGKISNRAMNGEVFRCVIKEYSSLAGKSALCFDHVFGELVAEIQPMGLHSHLSDRQCIYDTYKPMGNKSFPTRISCTADGKPALEINVTRLEELKEAGELFSPPLGATETSYCGGTLTAPKALQAADPHMPKAVTPKFPVILRVKVGINGKPQDVTVIQTVDKDFDKEAIKAVNQWRFKPAECDGTPTETEIKAEISFRVY
ncbi:MAG TPA: energy transducer TonB [Terriglobales bacterium]|jgi:TonB family protein|nr:energy transducer TonB [Terriglobales bacterium]